MSQPPSSQIIAVLVLTALLPVHGQLPGLGQCLDEYLCVFEAQSASGVTFGFDLRPLCATGASYSANDSSEHSYSFNICGYSNFQCTPSWNDVYKAGVAVQYWGDTPACNTSAPECTDVNGDPVCCTQDCQVLGVGIPVFQLQEPSNPETGGILVGHTGAQPADDDPFWCPWDPHTQQMAPRQITYSIACNESMPFGAVNILDVYENETSACSYIVVMESRHGCGCTPDCANKNCGPDGCGGYCGSPLAFGFCPNGYYCLENQICCRPDCDGRACGTDGCGNVCGTPDGECPEQYVCEDGECVATPDAPRPGQCFQQASCQYNVTVAGGVVAFDVSPLCLELSEYTASDGQGHDYQFNVCGNVMSQCMPPEWIVQTTTGVVVQTFGSVPVCNHTQPACVDFSGNPACCSSDCSVLGHGEPQFSLVDPEDPVHGGIQFTQASEPPQDDNPFWCPWNPDTGSQFPRSIMYTIQCNETMAPGTLNVLDVYSNTSQACQYFLVLESLHGCGVKHPSVLVEPPVSEHPHHTGGDGNTDSGQGKAAVPVSPAAPRQDASDLGADSRPSQCNPAYQCQWSYQDDQNNNWNFDLSSLCSASDYTVADNASHTYSFNICGVSSLQCLPEWAVTTSYGPAVQVFGSTPPCNESAPACVDPITGAPVCCTAPCEVFGMGRPMWLPMDPSNLAYGGIQIQYQGVETSANDQHRCNYNPLTGTMLSRTLTYNVSCDPTVPDDSPKVMAAVLDPANACHVTIVMAAAQACGCSPDCLNKNCGPDGCGGYCGGLGGKCPVASNYFCTSDQVCCAPSCDGRQCGADGCGGQCGQCTPHEFCNSFHKCVPYQQ